MGRAPGEPSGGARPRVFMRDRRCRCPRSVSWLAPGFNRSPKEEAQGGDSGLGSQSVGTAVRLACQRQLKSDVNVR